MKTYINNVLPKKVSDLVDDSGHYTKPSGGIPASDLADGVVPVEDVQVNGTSILSDGVANVPLMDVDKGTVGVATVDRTYGTSIYSRRIIISKATEAQIKNPSVSGGYYCPIVPYNQHESTFYGLAKAAGDTTQSASSNAVGTYTDDAKTAIRGMLGSISVEDIVPPYDGTATYQRGDYCTYNGKIYFANATISAAEEWTVAHWTETTLTSFASSQLQKPGLIGITPIWSGVRIDNSGGLYLTVPADSIIKQGTDNSRTSLIYQQHLSTFYGLAKAAGHDEKDSTLPVGQYTDEAKAAIKSMLDVRDGDLSVGTVTTLPSTENAAAEITGDYTAMTLNLGLPRGKSGVYIGAEPPTD